MATATDTNINNDKNVLRIILRNVYFWFSGYKNHPINLFVDAEGLMLGVGVAALVLICQKNFTTRTLRRLAVIGAFFFFHAGWMQYMRTHVYTQGGKPMLAALPGWRRGCGLSLRTCAGPRRTGCAPA